MFPREVECEKCGGKAIVKRAEGELDLGRNNSRVILIIDCPKCGEREKPEAVEARKLT